MKTLPTLRLAITGLVVLIAQSSAQIASPPSLIDYQGQLLNSIGGPLTGPGGAGTTGTAANFEIRFRLWDAQTGGSLIWAEKQIVTVDGNGLFSVRLGEGEVITVANGDPNPLAGSIPHSGNALLAAFDQNERFLGVTVMSPPDTPGEIQPRLKFLSSPFAIAAEKARYAEFGPSSGIFEAAQIGVGTSTPGSLLEVAGPIQLASDNGSGLMSSGAIGGNHIAFDADDIQGYANASSPGTLKLNAHGGDVEIGSTGNTTSVEGLFSVFGGGFGGQFKVIDEAAASNAQTIAEFDAAFGVSGAQIRFDGDALPVEIGSNSNGDFVVENSNNAQRFVVQQGGNVGIGTTAPSDRLHLAGSTSHLRLGGGDIKLLTLSGGFPYPTATYNPSIQWFDSDGNTQAQIYHWTTLDRLHVSTTDNSLTGVVLNTGATSWSSYSDERLKSDVEPVTGILDKIENIRVIGYDIASVGVDESTGKSVVKRNRPHRKMKDGRMIKQEIGSVAQDWVEHFPELVQEPQTEDDYYTLSYDRIGVVAIGAAQELNRKLQACEARLKERDEKVAELEARLAALESLVSPPGGKTPPGNK